MIRHVFKLVWNRKRANVLIMSEILVSFLVLCVVVTTVVYFFVNWQKPLGFDFRDVLEIHARFNWHLQDEEGKKAFLARLQRIEEELRGMEAIESAGLGGNIPYSGNTSSWQMVVHDRTVEVQWSTVSPEFYDVLRLDLVTGRWLEPGDEMFDWSPIIVNRDLARDLFGSVNPLGESLPRFEEDGTPRERKEDETDYRVVGVVSDFRRQGELSNGPYVAFNIMDFDEPDQWPPSRFLVRLRPGTAASVEDAISRRLHALAPDWTFTLERLDEKRSERLRAQLMSLLLQAVIAGFLLIMVGLGLMGVLWQNVARRTRELGLRRALGATSQGVRLQILGELLALTTIAALLGSVLFLQAAVLGIAGFVGWKVYLLGLVASLGILYYLVVLCGLYPSWLATRVHPARALQYE
jgi:putative ABC transport system permease protein